MTDTRDARSKAEASYRLAELAKTPRARELFRQLAQEYEAVANGEVQHGSIAQTDAAPSLVPIATLVPATAPLAEEPAASLAPSMAAVPLAPAAPLAESEQWIANLKAAREAS